MASSTFYGWAEPDDTGLVKNGAQDMRTLGDAIDASVWNIGYGQAGKNKIINSSFNIWQRGTSFAFGSPIYTADRWIVGTQSNVAGRTASRQTASLTGIQYCMRIARDSGNTSTSSIFLTQSLESSASYPFAGQTVTLSFYARAGANYSSPSNRLNAKVVWGTGTDQNLLTVGYTGSTNAIDQMATLTTSWQRFTYTGSIGSTATEIGFNFTSDTVGTAGAADFYEITGVQLEAGSKATPFQTASGGSPQAELAMCQRYFQRWSLTQFVRAGFVYADTTTNVVFVDKMPVVLRATPTLTFTNMTANGNAITAAAVGGYLDTNNTLYLNLTTSGVSANTVYQLYVASGQTGVISYSSEL
jgi:hypothetical protein